MKSVVVAVVFADGAAPVEAMAFLGVAGLLIAAFVVSVGLRLVRPGRRPPSGGPP